MTTKDKIEEILKQRFAIESLIVEDDSYKHAGHAEAQKSGGGHFRIRIVSNDFEGKNLLARHRMIYNALREELKTSIHALSIQALTLNES